MNKETVIIEAQRIPSHFYYDWLKCKARDGLWINFLYVFSERGFTSSYVHRSDADAITYNSYI